MISEIDHCNNIKKSYNLERTARGCENLKPILWSGMKKSLGERGVYNLLNYRGL